MNCKQGDLAVVVTVGHPRNPHRAIACALIGIPVRLAEGYLFGDQPAWKLEENLHLDIDGKGVEVRGIVDAVLKPLRDNDGEDEVLALTGKPIEVRV